MARSLSDNVCRFDHKINVTHRRAPDGHRLQGVYSRPVSIGNDVWMGARVIILPGVNIGCGAILGAGAVVVDNVPSYAIAAGVPARVVAKRGGSETVGGGLRRLPGN